MRNDKLQGRLDKVKRVLVAEEMEKVNHRFRLYLGAFGFAFFLIGYFIGYLL